VNLYPDATSTSADTQTIPSLPAPKPRRPRWGLLLIAAAAVLALCAGCAALIVTLQPAGITLVIDGQAQTVDTRAQTVGAFLQERGLLLREGDVIAPPPEAAVQPGMVIQITRARPVTLLVDGQVQVLATVLSQPLDILMSASVTVGAADRLIIDGTEVTFDQIADWPVPVTNISLRRALPIVINDEGVERQLTTTAGTVGEALFEAGVTLYLADSVSPDVDMPIAPNLIISVRRSRPVTVVADGERLQTRLQGETVADALASAGVALVGQDYVVPAETQSLVPGMTIRVIRVEETLLTETAQLPYETVYQADAALELDQRQTLQNGQPGEQRTTIRVRLENGVEVERVAEETVVVREPVNLVIVYGTNVVIRSINTPQGPREYWRVLRMYATSYHPAALGGDDRTSVGAQLTTGIIASDPDVLPYGTEVFVNDYGVGLMADTGGPRSFPLWIDLGYSDADFRPWSRYVNVYVLTPVPDVIDYFLPGT
jgi:uncharacterized protein YabE (DUF348 family)